MYTREDILTQMEVIKQQYGDWTYDIPLTFDIWTGGNLQIPHTRLKRIVQIASDLVIKSLSECRVLDLGCLDGQFSIEFAKHGAETIGVEIREANIKKAIFCKDILGLENLNFHQDDVRNLSADSYGKFDVILCSGILYHLPAYDAINLVANMYTMVDRLVIIDTHVALRPAQKIVDGDNLYYGQIFREHARKATVNQKEKQLWASVDNPTSFWFTRPSLINLLSNTGFSSIYECFIPAHLNFGKPGIEHLDRCTFVAIKDRVSPVITSPAANNINEVWPEKSLSYSRFFIDPGKRIPLFRKLTANLRRILKSY